MSTVRFVDPGVMCDHAAADGSLDCCATVYASQVEVDVDAVKATGQLIWYLRRKGWSVSDRRGRAAYDLCPLHSGRQVLEWGTLTRRPGWSS